MQNKVNDKNNNFNIFFPLSPVLKGGEKNPENFLFEKTEELLIKLSDNIKNDINYEIIFKDIYETIINSNTEKTKTGKFSKFISDHNEIYHKNFLNKR